MPRVHHVATCAAKGVVFELKGTKLAGHLRLMGKDQPIVAGTATQAGFEATVAVKIAFKKGEALVRGKRNGDSIAGTIELPMGTLEFTGTRE